MYYTSYSFKHNNLIPYRGRVSFQVPGGDLNGVLPPKDLLLRVRGSSETQGCVVWGSAVWGGGELAKMGSPLHK